MAFSGLRELFGKGELPTIVSDSPYVLNRFKEVGFKTLSLDVVSTRAQAAPSEVLLIPAASSVHPNKELLAALKQSAVLVVPLLAFAVGTSEVDYLIRRLSTLSFSEATKKNLELVEYVQHTDAPIVVESPGCRMIVELGDDVDIMVPKIEANIASGQWISIIQYLEIGLVPNSNNTSFSVNGTLCCEGVTVAHHLHSHFESGPVADAAWRFSEGLRTENRFPLIIEIENSRVKSISTHDGEDVLPYILPLTDEIMRGGLTEVAFGALNASEATDWSINSQLNEPAGGFHVGIGAGEVAAHIDFVSPHAVYR